MKFSVFSKSSDEIQAIQFKKVKQIVGVAYEKSEFYRQLYKTSDFHPDMLKKFDDIEKIPVAKRISLKNTPVESIVTRKDFPKLHLHTTSGSSGIPVKFYYTNKECFLKNYGVLRAYLMMGMKLTDRTVALRDPIDIRKRTVYERLGIAQYDYYNIYEPSDLIYQKICQSYENSSIDILKGMPSDLMNLAYMVRNGKLKFPKVKQIFTDSEVLDDFSRKYIMDTFNSSMLDFYASVENGCIAFQMPKSKKYFINEDQILLQNSNKNLVEGDAIITNLRNTTFPIIRYQIGDVVDFGDGKSDLEGMNVRTINKIYGKYLDFIILPDKTIVSPHVPKQELTHLKGIKKFQIIQKDFDKAIVKIERDHDYTEEVEKEILNRLSKSFSGQIACAIEYDDNLSVKGQSKFKCISSDIAQSFLTEGK
jgi:phenylacetate-CoA ligase